MAFGYRLRSQQSSRTQVDDPRTQQPTATTTTTTTTTTSSSSRHQSSNHDTAVPVQPRQPLHRIRLDSDSSAPAPAPPSQNNYLQQRLERAVLNSAVASSHSAAATTTTNSSTHRRDRELARSVLEPTSANASTAATHTLHARPTRTMTSVTPPPSITTLDRTPHGRSTRTMTTVTAPSSNATASFLDDRAQTMDLPRRRRGTTSMYSTGARSTTSSTSASSRAEAEHRAPPPRVDVLLKGPLTIKRGLLKGVEKRFYFVTRTAPELYCCKDETSFDLWYASGWGLDVSTDVAKASGLAPVLVCTVLRADRAGDANSSNDRAFVVAAAPTASASAGKPATLKLFAESAEKCERWLKALHRVQVAKRVTEPQDAPSPLSSTAASSSSSVGGGDGSQSRSRTMTSASQSRLVSDVVASPSQVHALVRSRQASRSDASQTSTNTSNSAAGPRAYATGLLRAASSRDDSQSVKSAASSTSNAAAAASESTATASNGSRAPALFHSTLSAPTSQSNVLLFVPAAGSAIALSGSKLALARKRMVELLAAGAKPPTRRGLDSGSVGGSSATHWRYGVPEYVLSDVEYMQHKQREPESTPLESYVEECCQTFAMDATHRRYYNDWTSVTHDAFVYQVNDTAPLAGANIGAHDLFGLLAVHAFDGADLEAKEGDAKDPRAMLAEAFADGFPLEVLEVFTQPPHCYFAWRHWGPFTGSYKGVKGDGRCIEVRGFGQMHVEAHRMQRLRLFVKTKDLFDALSRASGELGAKAIESQRARTVSSAVNAPSLVATASAAVPTTTKTKATLTADIMDELANFTIASSTAAAARSK